MGVPVQLVGEERLHLLATVLAGRQADGMDHQQIDAGAWGSGAEVGRIQSLGGCIPTLVPKAGGFSGVVRHGWVWAVDGRGRPGCSHRVAVLCGCAVLGAAVKALFSCNGFVLGQVDAAMQAGRHIGWCSRGG